MATPVVTVAAGGLPVVDVTSLAPKLGLPVTEALNGRGIAVTKVAAGGLPVTFSTDYPPPSGGTSAEAAAFLARTSGLDAPHTAAITALIDGLVADALWPTYDVVQVYAGQGSANCLLNLVSTSYNGIAGGSPAFVTDRGFTGVAASNTVMIDTGFNPSAAPSPKFTRNSAHLSVWSLTATSTNDYVAGVDGGAFIGLMPRYIDGNAYYYANGGQITGPANADPRGMSQVNRSTSAATQFYKNGSLLFSSAANNSTGLPNQSIHSLGYLNAGGGHVGQAWQEAMLTCGSSHDATQALKHYNRFRTYMTAVGVP